LATSGARGRTRVFGSRAPFGDEEVLRVPRRLARIQAMAALKLKLVLAPASASATTFPHGDRGNRRFLLSASVLEMFVDKALDLFVPGSHAPIERRERVRLPSMHPLDSSPKMP